MGREGWVEKEAKGRQKMEFVHKNGKNGGCLGSNPFVVFVAVWVKDVLGPEGTSSSYHSEQTAGTSFSLLASQL